jgi:hypothetical protein
MLWMLDERGGTDNGAKNGDVRVFSDSLLTVIERHMLFHNRKEDRASRPEYSMCDARIDNIDISDL